MEVFRFTVDPVDQGKRLDAYLSERTPFSRRRIQEMIREGAVRVEGASCPRDRRLRAGESVEVEPPPPGEAAPRPQHIPVKVLYQDRHLAVVSKPAGMVVHPAAGHLDGTLVNALLAALDDLAGVGGVMRPGIVHRLDKDTSGLMVVAKDDATHLALQDMVKDRRLRRSYLALVHGVPTTRLGTVEAPVGRDPRDRKRMKVISSGRPAITHFEVRESFPEAALLKVDLVTGRTHQIRVHMSYIGHPVVGDPTYGKRGRLEGELGLRRQFLHAYRLAFFHPEGGEEMVFEDPLPEDLSEALERLRSTSFRR